jgi:hypothetical protein
VELNGLDAMKALGQAGYKEILSLFMLKRLRSNLAGTTLPGRPIASERQAAELSFAGPIAAPCSRSSTILSILVLQPDWKSGYFYNSHDL